MFKILRKNGWILNPNDKVVNAILNRVDKNNGECPCQNPGETREDRLCPCKEYRENDCCHCGLYLELPKRFSLPNRDGARLWLQKSKDDYYTLETEGESFYKDYLRIIGDINHPIAVDPPGGPYLCIGYKLGNKVIDHITWEKGDEIKFYLKDADSEDKSSSV